MRRAKFVMVGRPRAIEVFIVREIRLRLRDSSWKSYTRDFDFDIAISDTGDAYVRSASDRELDVWRFMDMNGPISVEVRAAFEPQDDPPDPPAIEAPADEMKL